MSRLVAVPALERCSCGSDLRTCYLFLFLSLCSASSPESESTRSFLAQPSLLWSVRSATVSPARQCVHPVRLKLLKCFLHLLSSVAMIFSTVWSRSALLHKLLLHNSLDFSLSSSATLTLPAPPSTSPRASLQDCSRSAHESLLRHRGES